jgi:serine/threonine-protein kinase HipA
MPTRTRSYAGDVPQAFFDGLLPEGEARRIIAYDFDIAEDDVVGLLRALGRDCAGALVILPEGESPHPEGLPDPLTDLQIAERLRKLRVAPLGVDDRIRVSLAGLQAKLLLSCLADGWGLPVDGAPSTHILKPTHPLLVDSIPNEAFCMRIGHHLGIEVAQVEILTFGDVQALAIERYDRAPTDGSRPVVRLHQEDFCQALAIAGRRKYQDAGGPSLFDCAQQLLRWSASDQLERLLDIVTLNALVGNADAHAKNLALTHDRNGKVTLAPAYDITATIHHPNVSTVPGMFVGDLRDISTVTRLDVIREAVGWGIPEYTAATRVARLVEEFDTAVSRAAADVQPPDALVDTIAARAAKFA